MRQFDSYDDALFWIWRNALADCSVLTAGNRWTWTSRGGRMRFSEQGTHDPHLVFRVVLAILLVLAGCIFVYFQGVA